MRAAYVLVDGSQGAVHLPVDVQDIDCDFYALTGHKVYGPTGIGVLYGKQEQLEAMPPYQGGGEMIDTVTSDRVTYADPPYRFEAGTPPIVQASGSAPRSITSRASAASASRPTKTLSLAYAMERFGELNWLRIIGRAGTKGSIISFDDGTAPTRTM